MDRKWCGGAVLSVAMILASCEKPAAPDTREADAKAIEELEDTWSKVIETKDAAKFTSYYASDAAVFVTGLPAMHGTEAIAKGLKEAMADPNFSSTFKTTRVHVAKSGGDWKAISDITAAEPAAPAAVASSPK